MHDYQSPLTTALPRQLLRKLAPRLREAATAYINPLTALLMVRRMAPQPGDAVGITAAASVALIAVSLSVAGDFS